MSQLSPLGGGWGGEAYCQQYGLSIGMEYSYLKTVPWSMGNTMRPAQPRLTVAVALQDAAAAHDCDPVIHRHAAGQYLWYGGHA